VAWSVRGRTAYCLDGQAYTAGSAVDWMVSAGLLSAAESLDAECGADTAGVVFVPGLAGLAPPWWRSDPSGAFLGMGLSAGRAELVRAVVEGLACQVAVLVEELERGCGTTVPRLRVDGGLTRSQALMQAHADLLQRPVDCYASPHATALGAAAMGRLAVEPALTLDEAVGDPTPAATYRPRWSADRAARTLATWRAGVDTVLGRQGSS
jgi:glycerol kinase